MDKKSANILLLSDKMFEYEVLKKAGYENVFWFKSGLRAYEYFKEHPEELNKYDIILMGSMSLVDVNNYKYSRAFLNYVNRENSIPYMKFFSSKYEEDDKKKVFYLAHPYKDGNGVSKEEFLDTLMKTIPDELKGEKITIPEVKTKEKTLPKTKDNVKILFMGYLVDIDVVRKFFEEAGFSQFDYVRSNNFSLRDNVENLGDYDLIIADYMFNGSLMLLGDEFQDYMRDKDKNIYFVAYDYEYRKGYFLVQGFGTDKPDDKDLVKFDSMDDEKGVIRDIMGSVINMYAKFNPNIEGGYPTQEDLEEKYKRQYQEFMEEKKIIDYNYGLVSDIMVMLDKYRAYYNRGQLLGYMTNAIKSLKVDVLSDGVSVAFIVQGREVLRMTFRDDDREILNLEPVFYIEYLNGKGTKLIAPKKCECSSSSCDKKSELYPSDEEIKKIEGLHKKMEQEITPIIEGLAHVDQVNKDDNKHRRNKNKRYSKKYV